MKQNGRVAATVLNEIPGKHVKKGNWFWLNESEFNKLEKEGYVEEYHTGTPLPQDFPGRLAFVNANISTIEEVQKLAGNWQSVNGIGPETEKDLEVFFAKT